MKRSLMLVALAVALFGFAAQAGAVTQLVGDVDGFGIDPTGLVRATGYPHTQPADVDGDGIIEAGEFLPDWNRNGSVAINSNDPFDFRSAAELAATNGAELTDWAIIGTGAAHGATFTFSFAVPAYGDIDYGVDHFINFVFGDYDVYPTSIVVDGTTVSLTTQGGGLDGLVQTAYATVPWADLLDGYVVIQVLAPNEPYLAFDYALLDTDQIADRDGDGVPDNVDNCPDDPNTDQIDTDGDGFGDACDPCDDFDEDGVCDDEDNCVGLYNPGQDDEDGDGFGDACDVCPFDADNDADGDGVCGDIDLCADTVLPEDVPTLRLGVNRWADIDGDGIFESVAPKGKGPRLYFTIEDTLGCSCAQIIDFFDLGAGHVKFGCSISAMEDWLAYIADMMPGDPTMP